MYSQKITSHVQKIHSRLVGKALQDGTKIDPIIAASWDRCFHHYGIDPGEARPVQILTTAELREHTRPIEQFARIAKAALQILYRQVANLGYATLLCDSNGVTVDCQGDKRFSRQWKASGLYLGAVWKEHQEGTCGVGTSLVEQVPLTIHKDEHFRARNANLTSSCAPIFGPNGKLLGLIDVSAFRSSHCKDSQHFALQLVAQSARMIETAYFLSQFEDQWVLRISPERELAEVSSGCLVALDGDGCILAADRIACCLLASEHGAGRLVGKPVGEVFDVDFKKLLEMFSRSSMVLPIHTQKMGHQIFASLRCPQTYSARPVTRAEISTPRKRKVPAAGEPFTLDYLAGEDLRLKECVERIKRVMNKPIPILLNGETGTGKEMFAQAIHHASRRGGKPFVAVNCASIPESLIESELFGYKDGAFTGARSKGMRGKILQSDGGTLFLDEIGDMPANLQSRLLRVLAEREVTPLGGETPIPVDLHVICATHRNIKDLVACGAFREDLYYRLNGVSFELSPLRQRSDIETLIGDVLAIETDSGAGSVAIDDKAMRIMSNFSWPGNIRQLRNALRYALAVCEKGIITCADLPADVICPQDTKEAAVACLPLQAVNALSETIESEDSLSLVEEVIAGLSGKEQVERRVMLEALQKHKWQISSAVKEVGISRATMYRKMDKYAIVPPNKQ